MLRGWQASLYACISRAVVSLAVLGRFISGHVLCVIVSVIGNECHTIIATCHIIFLRLDNL